MFYVSSKRLSKLLYLCDFRAVNKMYFFLFFSFTSFCHTNKSRVEGDGKCDRVNVLDNATLSTYGDFVLIINEDVVDTWPTIWSICYLEQLFFGGSDTNPSLATPFFFSLIQAS